MKSSTRAPGKQQVALLRRSAAIFLCGIAAGAGPNAFAQTAPGSLGRQVLELRSNMSLVIEYPSNRTVLPEAPGCGTYVAGWTGVTRFDVIFVIDTSESTRDPSGADIDGDGQVGRAWIDESEQLENSDPDDSILAAEIAAAREILQSLHPTHTRVGIVAFSGSPSRPLEWLFPRAPSARIAQTLTLDHTLVSGALDRMASRPPGGGTDIAAGIDRALDDFETVENDDTPGFERQRLLLFFTDGYPTLPFDAEAEAANISAVLEATARAREAGARIHTFAIGTPALDSPIAVVEMAARSGGTFTPIRHPADLVDAVQHAVSDDPYVSLRNATTGEEAFPFSVGPDGSFQGFVHLAQGSNRLELQATSEGAPVQVETLDLDLDPSAPTPVVPAYLHARHIALLEKCLEGLKRLTLEAERERAERLRPLGGTRLGSRVGTHHNDHYRSWPKRSSHFLFLCRVVRYVTS